MRPKWARFTSIAPPSLLNINDMPISFHEIALTRRRALCVLASAAYGPVHALAENAQPRKKQLTEDERYLLPALTVNNWLAIDQTSLSDVQSNVQSIVANTRGATLHTGPSEITHGEALTMSSVAPLLGDPWLRVLSIAFNPKNKLELVIFMFQRKPNDANVETIINRLTKKLEFLAPPILIAGTDEEAADRYYIFDIGKFVVELSIPQYSSLIPVYFTTKATHKTMRTADGTYDKFSNYLEKKSRS
ncbi:hypothetical protein [Simplicispira suum]|uniref:Uncharacterized protein n=1 Tax=Simplicispira suum TaxID=2109915 RepID=A0A2S0N5Y9_9BURK|nr:hypothetical protein [Simplicispira suum]AVO43447.1 hypothetical protein C6571_18650 [Simplicispira suum]